MAKRDYDASEARYRRMFAEGRGEGHGRDYKPFLTTHDVSSLGRSSRLAPATTGRVTHVLSDLERMAVLDCNWHERVVDIREQFPLDRAETLAIAAEIGVRHPSIPRTDVVVVMTTDLLVTIEDSAGARRDVAICTKYAADLEKPRTIAKLQIERSYWDRRSVPWHCVTEKELSKVRARVLDWLDEWRDVSRLAPAPAGAWGDLASLLLEAIEVGAADAHRSVGGFFASLEKRHGWVRGDALAAFRHLAATRRVAIDVEVPFDVDGPPAQIGRVAPADVWPLGRVEAA